MGGLMNGFRFLLIVFAAASATLQAAEPVQWGINGHPLTQEGYWQVPLDEQLDLVKESGATWYRISFGFDAYRANTARFDELLEKAGKRNLKLLPVLMPPKGFYDGSKPLAEIQQESIAFGKEMAARYKGRITHWELGNELDSFAMIKKGETTRGGKVWKWDGAPDGKSPEDYETTRYERCREFFKSLGQGIKQADPKALTMIDTAGWLHYGFLQRLKEDGADDFNIVAWHWYSEMGPLTAVSKDKIDVIKILKDGFGKPIWLTEINRRDGSKGGKEDAQAEYLSGAVAELSKHPDIHAVFLYELLDEPYFGESGESFYGLATVTKATGKWRIDRKKPAFEAVRKLTATKE
jgi:hypothetical protein